MARIRTIKPEFFKNEQLAELEPIYRLLFVGLWNHADRDGRLEDRPKRLKAEILPYDDCDLDKALSALQKSKFIIRYSSIQYGEEINCIQIVNFVKHQKIDKFNEKESQIPEYQQDNSIVYEKTIDSLLINGEGKGRERKGKEGSSDSGEAKTKKESTQVAPPAPPQVVHPFTSDAYLKLWENWKQYRKVELNKKYKSAQGEQAAITHLSNLAGGLEQNAIDIIMQSMGHGWHGLFELRKQNNNGSATNINSASQRNKQTIFDTFGAPPGTF